MQVREHWQNSRNWPKGEWFCNSTPGTERNPQRSSCSHENVQRV
nr:MAG TPA: hypothetical protein [Caudoviricetes sp.]